MELDVNGHTVFAATGGKPFDPEKPGVIFLHGAGNDHTVWQLPARYFAYHGRSVMAVDLPGHGRSGGEPLTSVDAIADWVVDLFKATGLKEVALAGHSMGALIALAAAAKLKKKVTALALLGVAGRIPVQPQPPRGGEAERPRRVRNDRRLGIRAEVADRRPPRAGGSG